MQTKRHEEKKGSINGCRESQGSETSFVVGNTIKLNLRSIVRGDNEGGRDGEASLWVPIPYPFIYYFSQKRYPFNPFAPEPLITAREDPRPFYL